MWVHVCMCGDGLRGAVVHALHAPRIHSHIVHARHVLHGTLRIHRQIRVLLTRSSVIAFFMRHLNAAIQQAHGQVTVGSQGSPRSHNAPAAEGASLTEEAQSITI